MLPRHPARNASDVGLRHLQVIGNALLALAGRNTSADLPNDGFGSLSAGNLLAAQNGFRMPVRVVSFTDLYPPFAASVERVVGVGAKKHMVGPHAERLIATGAAYMPIAAPILCAQPRPAFVRAAPVDLFPEAFSQWPSAAGSTAGGRTEAKRQSGFSVEGLAAGRILANTLGFGRLVMHPMLPPLGAKPGAVTRRPALYSSLFEADFPFSEAN